MSSFRFAAMTAALALAGCRTSDVPGQGYAATIAEGRAAMKDVMADATPTSISVALVEGERVVWSEALGPADPATDRAATPATLYGIASVSKMAATVATLILVDRGQISLDDPVVKHVPAFTMPLDARHKDITVRMLLNHSSGLPGNESRGARSDEPFTRFAAQMMEGFALQRLKHDPGAQSTYNNDGFSMVENLVEAVSGQRYPDFVRQNVLEPLEMTTSRYQTEPLPDGVWAKSYDGSVERPLGYTNVYASGGLFSTPEELSHLASMVLGKGLYKSRRILSEAAVAAMAEDQRQGQFNPIPCEAMRFGLGWDSMAEPSLAAAGIKGWQKGGTITNFRTLMTLVPEENLAVVVFVAAGTGSKLSNDDPERINHRILLRALVERGRLAAMPAAVSKEALPVVQPTAQEKSDYAGIYSSGSSLYRLSFSAEGSLTVEQLGTGWAPLVQGLKLRSDGWYAADADAVTAVRLVTEAGHRYFGMRSPGALAHYTSAITKAEQIDPGLGMSQGWKDLVGETWLLANVDAWYLDTVAATSLQSPEGLPGYLMATNLLREATPPSADRLDGMFLTAPDAIRDLLELSLEDHGGQRWIRLGSILGRPASKVPSLPTGAGTVAIGSEGYVEWRKLPAAGTVSVGAAKRWFLFDERFTKLASGGPSGTSTFSGAGAKFLAVLADRGTSVDVQLAE